MTVNKWDIWLANVRFENDPTVSKQRPVLIINADELYYVDIASITSHPPRRYDLFDYLIKDYRGCGLDKESTIRLDHKATLLKNNLVHKIGELSRTDIINVEIILARRKTKG